MSPIYESLYIIEKNKKICKEILKKSEHSPNEIIDFLLSLHIVLECSLNGFIRELTINAIQKDAIDKTEIADNLDKIDFISKITMFVYMEKYNFGNDLHEANNHHKIIGKLKNFSNTRNRLMHGSMIGSFEDSPFNSMVTTTVNLLNLPHMNNQIAYYKSIIEGVQFYLEHLKYNNTAGLKEKFLDTSFLG